MRLLLMLGAFLLNATALGAEVYRWTDSNGQVHFSQRPPPVDAEKLELPEGGAPAAADTSLDKRRERQRRVLQSYEYEREQKKAAATKAEQEKREMAAKCADMEKRWRRLSYGGPLYYRNDGGEREYLSEQQRTEEKARLRPYFKRYCGREP